MAKKHIGARIHMRDGFSGCLAVRAREEKLRCDRWADGCSRSRQAPCQVGPSARLWFLGWPAPSTLGGTGIREVVVQVRGRQG